MKNQQILTTFMVVGALMATGATRADDGDVQHARILLEEAQTFGVSGVAAGQTDREIEEERNFRRRVDPETLTEDDRRWAHIVASQSHD